jgi:hypothetical protein
MRVSFRFDAFSAASALVAALYPSLSHATALSQASLQHVTISLVDLMPDDGIAPSIRFPMEGESAFGPSVTGQVAILSSRDGSEIYSEFFNNGGNRAPFSDAGGQATFGNSTASASFTVGEQTTGAHHWQARGAAQSPARGANAYYRATTIAPGFFARSFELTPHTLALFEGDAEVFANVDGASPDGAASASIEMSVTGVGISGIPGSRQLVTDVLGINAEPGEFRSVTRPMSVSFLNNAEMWLYGQFVTTVHVSGHDMSAPIPEPAEGALVLAGLAVLGMRSRYLKGVYRTNARKEVSQMHDTLNDGYQQP